MKNVMRKALLSLVCIAWLVIQVFAVETRTLAIYQDGEGSISVTSPVVRIDANIITCVKGEAISLKLTPKEGHEIQSITVNGESRTVADASGTSLDIVPQDDDVLTVIFGKVPEPSYPTGQAITTTDIQESAPVSTPIQMPGDDLGMGISPVVQAPPERQGGLPSLPFAIAGFAGLSIIIMRSLGKRWQKNHDNNI